MLILFCVCVALLFSIRCLLLFEILSLCLTSFVLSPSFSFFVLFGLLCFEFVDAQLSFECHHSSSQSEVPCIFIGLLQKLSVSCRYVSLGFVHLFFYARHDMFWGLIRLVLSFTPVCFVLYHPNSITHCSCHDPGVLP